MNIPVGKITIALLLLMAIIIGLSLSDNPITFIGFMFLIGGGLSFLIAHITLGIAAFSKGMATGLLFIFVPIYDMVFASGQYEGEHKLAITVCWYGGAFIGVIGSLVLIWGIF